MAVSQTEKTNKKQMLVANHFPVAKQLHDPCGHLESNSNWTVQYLTEESGIAEKTFGQGLFTG